MFECGGGDFGRPARICFGQYAADEQALSAHGLEYAGFFADFLQGGGEFRALADGVGAGGFAVDDVEGGAADGAGQGVAAELTTVSGQFVMMYVSSQLSDEVEDVVQTALRCLSRKDLEAVR